MLTDEEKAAKIAELKSRLDALYKEIEATCKDLNVSFHCDGPTYGAGFSYDPEDIEIENYWGETSDGWYSSSQGC